MASFIESCLSCRVKRAARLYKSVYDSEPVSVVVPVGTTFTSLKQYESDRIGFVHITEASDEFRNYWCPTSSVQTKTVVEEKKEEPTTAYTEYTPFVTKLVIKSLGATVYRRLSDHFSIPVEFRVGDEITTEYRNEVLINGQRVTRYRIAATTSEDQTIVGHWINADQHVNDTSVSYITTTPKPKLRAARLSATKAVATSASVSAGSGSSNTDKVIINGVAYYPNLDTSGTSIKNGTVTSSNNTGFIANMMAKFDDMYNRIIGTSGSTLYNAQRGRSGYIGRMLFVHGMPFQYTFLTDRRNGVDMNFGRSGTESARDIDNTKDTANVRTDADVGDAYGRSFAKEIAFNIPIAVLNPGKPHFLQPVKEGILGGLPPFTNTRNAKGLLGSLYDATENMAESILEAADEEGGEFDYYSIDFDSTDYYKYVNSLSAADAVLTGLKDMVFHGQRVGEFRWEEYNSSVDQDFTTLEDTLGVSDGISFAYDPQGSVSNTIQNSTTESMLANTFNELSSKAREINFIAGYTGSGMNWIQKNAEEASASISTNGGIIPDGMENVISRVKAWALNSAQGMNIRFPEIWSESNHSPSYEMECHFITPYATPFCIWRYVRVPFFHLFALAAPKSQKNHSQYSAPFLIKAYSKGYFNVEMGIIDSITWKRFGEGDMISEDGLPTQIDVSITFKDLYHTLTITNTGEAGENTFNFMNNSGLMEMIGTMSGINMSRMTITERMSLFANSTRSALGTLKGNWRNRINDSIRNTLSGLGINRLKL